MSHIRNYALLIFIALLATGCSWFGGDDEVEVRVPNELADIDASLELKKLWSVDIGRGAEDRAIKLVPDYSGSRVFASAADGTVKALDSRTGKEIWKLNIKSFYSKDERKIAFSNSSDTITGGVGVGEDLVLVGSAAGEIAAMNQSDGSLAWRAKTTSEVLAPPQAKDQLVVAQTIDGKVAGYEALAGERLWLYSTSEPSLTLRGTSTPIIADFVVAAFANGRVVVLDKARGLAVIDQRIAVAQGKSDLEKLIDIDGEMVLDNSRLYVVAYQGNVVALDLASRGRPVWTQESSSFSGLGMGFGNIYVSREDSVVVAHDEDNGKEIWSNDSLLYRDITAPVAISSYIAVGDFEGYLHIIAQSDGRFVARAKVDGKGLNSPAVVDGSRIYTMGNSGRLSAFEIVQ